MDSYFGLVRRDYRVFVSYLPPKKFFAVQNMASTENFYKFRFVKKWPRHPFFAQSFTDFSSCRAVRDWHILTTLKSIRSPPYILPIKRQKIPVAKQSITKYNPYKIKSLLCIWLSPFDQKSKRNKIEQHASAWIRFALSLPQHTEEWY